MKKTVLLVMMVFVLMVFLAGCNWFERGLLNVINPRSEVRMYYAFQSPTGVDGMELITRRTLTLVVYPLNEVGFTVETLQFRYLSSGGSVPELSRDLGMAYYIPPNPYTPGGVTTPGTTLAPYAISNLPLFSQAGIDYLWRNPNPGDLALSLTAVIRDDAGNRFEHRVIDHFPVLEMGEDFIPPQFGNPPISGPTSGTVNQTLTFIANVTDNYRVQSIRWFVNGGGSGWCPAGGGGGCPSGSGGGTIFSHTFDQAGTYVVVAEACDYAGNCAQAAVTVEISE